MPDIFFVRDTQPVPFTHYAASTETVPAIRRNQVASVTRQRIDVTSSRSTSWKRDFVTTAPIFRMLDGTEHQIPEGLVDAALAGGGRFVRCYPNEMYDRPLTRKEHLRRKRIKAEADAHYAAMEWW